MSGNDANKENEGPAPSLNKNVTIFATDMTESMRTSIVGIAHRVFMAPVNHGKLYETVAGKIRAECEKEHGGGEPTGKDGSGSNPFVGSGGWSCVVGDAFGSSVTHRIKTYIHFSVVPGVNILLWKS